MTTERMLWSACAILLVFILNQVFGRLISKAFDGGRRSEEQAKRFVGVDVHEMCRNHTRADIESLKDRFEGMEIKNSTEHGKLFDRMEEIRIAVVGAPPTG